MFKKKNRTAEDEESNFKTVVSETVESSDGVTRTITKTTVVKTSNTSGIEDAFKDFDMNKGSFATTTTKKIVHSSNDKSKPLEKELANGSPKQSKSLSERLGFKPKNKEPKASADEALKSLPAVKPGKFEDDCLKAHNLYRTKHGVPPLKLSKQLCSYSKEWADHLAATEKFQHRTERKYGENLYMKWSSDPNHVVNGIEAVDSWYSEIKDYTFGSEPKTLKSGHFTQVIWKESSELGVAWARSSKGKIVVVANYSPPGNFVGKFTENVPPPKK